MGKKQRSVRGALPESGKQMQKEQGNRNWTRVENCFFFVRSARIKHRPLETTRELKGNLKENK